MHEVGYVCYCISFDVCFNYWRRRPLSGVLGRAATANNDFVFELFLGPFVDVLFFAWMGEKAVLRLWKKKE